MPSRFALLTLAALAVVAASCGSSAERELGTPVRWTNATVDATDQTLRIQFVGGPEGNLDLDPCAGEYEAVIEESADTLTVTIHQVVLADRNPDVFCSLVGQFRQLEVDAVLDQRTLVDGATGEIRGHDSR